MIEQIVGWVAAGISLAGTIAINYRNVKGMYLWIISNLIWIYYGIYIQVNVPQVAMFTVFTITNIHGIRKWKS